MSDSTLTWPEVAARLAPWRPYWLGTTTPSGAPHAAPAWGAVLDDVFYIFSGPAGLPRVLAAFAAKYTGEDDRQYLSGVDPAVDVIYAIRPRSAMMWRLADYEKSQRRWTGS